MTVKHCLKTLAFIVCLVGTVGVSAAETAPPTSDEPPHVSVFVRDDCAHCRAEKAFLAEWMREDSSLRVRYYNIDVPEHRAQFVAIAKRFGLSQGTPITLAGTTIIAGFDTAQTTGAVIRDAVSEAKEFTTVEEILEDRAPPITVASSLASVCSEDVTEGCAADALSVRLPWGTSVNLATFSLGAIAAILGFIDGFNPCAMWVLVVFLTLLLHSGSRRRMWQYAGLFILAEALMYYLILMVWFSAWDFVGLSRIVTPLVGALALGSGVYFLYKWATWRAVCNVTGEKRQERFTNRMRELAEKPLTLVTALGVIGIAFSVNVFEFACSIGIPQTFTKILEMNALSTMETQGYMLIYILLYMIDDVVVFALALYGMGKIRHYAMSYSRWTTLLGGVLMVALGLILLLAPQWLVF